MGTTTTTRRAKLTAAIGLLTMLFGAVLVAAPGAAADHTQPTHSTVVVGEGNQPCPAGTADFKIEGPEASPKTSGEPYVVEDDIKLPGDETTTKVTVTYTPDGNDPLHIDWTSTEPVAQVIVKQSTSSAIFNFDGDKFGTVYVVTVGSAGEDDVSHISFCLQGEPPSTLRVVKAVTGNDAPATWTFPFTATHVVGSFDLTNTTSSNPATGATEVDPGSYTITETDTKSADSTSVSCTGNATDEVVTGASVAVTVAAGEDVVCTFTNTYNTSSTIPPQTIPPETTTTTAPAASLQIIKAVTGDEPPEWSFDFTGDLGAFRLTNVSASNTEIDLEPGDYTVTEVADAVAELVDVTCTGATATVDEETVTVTLEDGDAAECTFTNNFPEVQPSEVTAPPTTTTTTEPPPEVLPEVVVRPTTLPRTGNETRNLAGVGAALLVFGAVLVGASRKELAQR